MCSFDGNAKTHSRGSACQATPGWDITPLKGPTSPVKDNRESGQMYYDIQDFFNTFLQFPKNIPSSCGFQAR